MGCNGSKDTTYELTGKPREADDEEHVSEADMAQKISQREQREKSLSVAATLTGVDITMGKLSTQRGPSTAQVGMLNSQAQFANADQTIIIFDWDDTILPSTAIKQHNIHFDKRGKPLETLDDAFLVNMQMIEEQAMALLETAQSLGKVVLVTNAKRPWVDFSCKAFLPGLSEIMKEIPVIYGLELVKPDAKSKKLPHKKLLTETKMRAMRAAVTEFYSRYPGQSWKNIVTLGDALFEHNAVRQIVEEHMQTAKKKCRTKTFKFLDCPTIMGLRIQICIASNWLTKLVQADRDVHIDLSSDQATITGWLADFGETMEGANGQTSTQAGDGAETKE